MGAISAVTLPLGRPLAQKGSSYFFSCASAIVPTIVPLGVTC
jgi:hypothetical protein